MATATIKIQNSNAYYEGVKLGFLTACLIDHFKLKNGEEYVITITEGRGYKINGDKEAYYHFYKTTKILRFFPGFTKYVGLICKQHFNNLFFVPNSKKRYSISVKKIRKEK